MKSYIIRFEIFNEMIAYLDFALPQPPPNGGVRRSI